MAALHLWLNRSLLPQSVSTTAKENLYASFYDDGQLRHFGNYKEGSCANRYVLELEHGVEAGVAILEQGSFGTPDKNVYRNGECEQFDAWSDNSRPQQMKYRDWIWNWIGEIVSDFYHYAPDEPCSLESYEKTLAIQLDFFGEKTREAVIAYNNLGWALAEQGLYERAATTLERAREVAILLGLPSNQYLSYGCRSYGLWANLLTSCAEARRGCGKLDDAEPLLLEALALRQKWNDGCHPHLSQMHETQYCLAKLYRDKSEFAKSSEYFEKAILASKKRFDKHIKICRIMEDYAALLRGMDRQDEADNMEVQSRKMRQEL